MTNENMIREIPKKGKNVIGIDIGYGHTKVAYEGLTVKFPTAIAYFTDNGISYGENTVYEFEGEKYVVGTDASSAETFSTTDYKIIEKFAPLIIYHILNQFKEAKVEIPIEIRTGLALVDWEQKENFAKRIQEFVVNGETIKTNPIIVPQGVGVYNSYRFQKPEAIDETVSIIDIGFNTINLINLDKNKPQPQKSKSYPSHGVSSIIKPFVAFLENSFKAGFNEQEAVEIFLKGSFSYGGEVQEKISDYITDEKRKFIQKLFNSILVNDKKTLSMSDTVIISGGGAYLLDNVALPKNVLFLSNGTEKAYEYSNVRGYYLI